MAPKTPKVQLQKPKVNNDGNVSKTVPGSGSLGTQVNYAEVQDEEIEVLRAIYMEDFEDVEVKSAWSKTTDRAFKLKVKSFSDDETWVMLVVKLTITYPKTAPIIKVEGLGNLHARTQTRITRIAERRPAEMLGEVMIHGIASEIQDALEDAVQAREQGVLPSLGDERAVHEAAISLQAQEQEEADIKREQEAKAEEDRALRQMVQEEVERREARKPVKAPSQSLNESQDIVTSADIIRFDQPLQVPVNSGYVEVDRVQLVGKIQHRADAQVYAAKPVATSDTILAVRRTKFDVSNDDSGKRHDLLALEEELEMLKSLRQSNIVNVYAFKLDRESSETDKPSFEWQVTILSDLANRGTIEEFLENGQVVPVEKVRQWSLDILEALDFLHRHGVIHKSIHCRNILLSRTSAGVTVPLLSDAAYEYRLRCLQTKKDDRQDSANMAWSAPECVGTQASYTRKSDIWDFGVVLLQMLLGLGITTRYSSPAVMMESEDFSDALTDLLYKLFSRDARLRPTAFDVIPSEFLRSNAAIFDAPVLNHRRRQSSSLALPGHRSPLSRRQRRESSGITDAIPLSRYTNDFTELHRLGRGGFGEVVKARNKVDGGIYAIKKIKQDSRTQLEQVLSEVMLLHRLNHAYVVRYYTAWVEDDLSGNVELDESAVSTSEDFSSSNGLQVEFGMSSRGLDFVSSNGYNDIHFGDDSEDGDEDDESDDESIESSAAPTGTGSQAVDDADEELPIRQKKNRTLSQRMVRSTLYIQMEFCERRTLRDLIVRGMHEKPDEGWQMLRQILEGLAHIHGHGIIHRDLKPDNVFIDIAGNPRIGDFGLATTSRYQPTGKIISSHHTGGDMTRSVGTALYVAPELQSGSVSSYNDKVDMYSLGIIFFEMCYPLPTAMERLLVLQDLRKKDHTLPTVFQSGEKMAQGNIIESLISHSPGSRPSSVELLRSGNLPLQIEDETIRRTLQSLSDSGSPYYQKMLSALFAQTTDQRVKDYAWDARTDSNPLLTADEMRARTAARSIVTTIFRRHGAEETSRSILLPRSNIYTNPNVVQLLDSTGSLLQLPYDLTLPFARSLTKSVPAANKTYVFGQVYRDVGGGGQPRTYGEVDFDIVSCDSDDSVVHDAEVVKVVEEILDETPALASASMAFHLNHADILDIILEYCRIDPSQRVAVKETISKLNFHQWTWTKIRAELRSPLLGIPSTSLDELAQFDFRDTPEKAISKIESLFEDTTYTKRLQGPIRYLRGLIETLHLFGVHRKLYICPLTCHNEKFYGGGFLFQCVNDKKNRSVFVAGGRYDSLIEGLRAHTQNAPACRAVGVNIGWDGLISAVLRHQRATSSSTYLKKGQDESQTSSWDEKRCDVLIASSDPTVLRSTGVKLVTTLWAADISAELATDSRSVDDLLGRQRDKLHSWIVMVKYESAPTVKVRNTGTDAENEVATSSLLSHIRSEMRERDMHLIKQRRPPPALLRGISHSEQERKANVQVLMSQHRSKKSNKFHIVEAAQQKWRERVEEFKDAPILAIETEDKVLEGLRETRLGDPESWRRAIQSVQLSERKYVQQVHDILQGMRAKWEANDGPREACIFNFRSGGCTYYDLGL
ncbi:hypothetical protein MBLNU457_5203t1 [Dothideomycetes sp. NU457]